MEVADLSDLLNVRSIKMETDNTFEETQEVVESSDPLSVIPQFVTENDLGLMQSGTEILPAPLTIFSDVVDDEDTMQSNESNNDDGVIVQLMDIRTRLSNLRTMLENRVGYDLSDYTFWLQDAKMLDCSKTLVELCVRGAGVVQIHAQIKPNQKRINIMDVLRPDDEVATAAAVEAEEVVEEEPPCSPPPQQSTPVKWLVDPHYRSEQARLNIPNDPAEWTVQQVKLWIQWAVRQFNLTKIKLSDWKISGKQLCAMTNAEYKEKVPSDPGDIFWTHFELLRKCKFIAVVQNENEPTDAKQEIVALSVIKKKKPKTPSKIMTDEELSQYSCTRQGANGQIQLWQFLLELLTTAEYYHVIRWHGTEGEFHLLEPEIVSKLWGARKNKPAMNYEKLSRALRYYYDGDMISKVPGKRFVYKFVCNLKQLLGYDAAELAERVAAVRNANNT